MKKAISATPKSRVELSESITLSDYKSGSEHVTQCDMSKTASTITSSIHAINKPIIKEASDTATVYKDSNLHERTCES